MANITITVQSLINTAIYDSYTISDSSTVDQLKTVINSARGFDSAWYDIVFNENLLSGSDTLASLSIITGSILRTHNKIPRMSTRELRQIAKLNLAVLDRVESGRPSTYDITKLPTYYDGDDVVDNSNTGGLIEGRPWA